MLWKALRKRKGREKSCKMKLSQNIFDHPLPPLNAETTILKHFSNLKKMNNSYFIVVMADLDIPPL